MAPHGREPVSDGEGAERRRERKGPVVAPVHVWRMCTITDEIPQDLDHALGAYEELGINTVELCVVGGVNVVSHDEAGIARKVAAVEDRCVRSARPPRFPQVPRPQRRRPGKPPTHGTQPTR